MTGVRSYIAPACIAIAMHGILLYLASGTWFDQESERRVQPFRHVNAELIDLKAFNRAEEEKAQQARNAAEARRKALAEQEARKSREAEAKKRQAKQQEQKKREAEQARKNAEEKKRKAASEKALAQKKAAAEKARQAEARNQAEAEKVRQLKARRDAELAEAARQKAEQQRQQEKFAARAAAEEQAREAAVREQQVAEQARTRAAEERQVVASAGSLIRQVIASYWSRPPSARNGMEVELRIHLLPTGEVDDTYVVRSSGDGAFDRSAVNAVLKAERFPELQQIDPVVFDRYLRRINLKFRPEDLRL